MLVNPRKLDRAREALDELVLEYTIEHMIGRMQAIDLILEYELEHAVRLIEWPIHPLFEDLPDNVEPIGPIQDGVVNSQIQESVKQAEAEEAEVAPLPTMKVAWAISNSLFSRCRGLAKQGRVKQAAFEELVERKPWFYCAAHTEDVLMAVACRLLNDEVDLSIDAYTADRLGIRDPKLDDEKLKPWLEKYWQTIADAEQNAAVKDSRNINASKTT